MAPPFLPSCHDTLSSHNIRELLRLCPPIISSHRAALPERFLHAQLPLHGVIVSSAPVKDGLPTRKRPIVSAETPLRTEVTGSTETNRVLHGYSSGYRQPGYQEVTANQAVTE